MLNPGTGELFSSGHSQERDKRPLKVVHSIEVLLQVNLLTILSTLVIKEGYVIWGGGGGKPSGNSS